MKYHVDDGRRSRVTRRRPTPTPRRGVPPCGGRDVSKVNNITKHKREQSKFMMDKHTLRNYFTDTVSHNVKQNIKHPTYLRNIPEISYGALNTHGGIPENLFEIVSDVKLAQRRTRGQGHAEERVGEFVGHYIERGRKLRAADTKRCKVEGSCGLKMKPANFHFVNHAGDTHCQANPPVIPSRSRSLRLRCLEGMVSSGLIGGPPPPPPAPLPPPENNAIPSAFR
ncbi:hypothetical protein ALC57_15043 [Trachymyrmex cornetzi]|uniref:Uncharacterized protein n=1 Tax=Trachymyrmex cornetzi TaxID=471704 RepID=A0A195DIN1_9HYME|nr:hypothetical protein ALC57_15043 [Trachymyrmex cornetzi]